MTDHAPRFDMDAPDLMGASRYFERRALQGLMDGYTWTGLITPLTDERGEVWGARTNCDLEAYFTKRGVPHRETHPRREALDRYFRLWLERLGVSRETFALLFERLQIRPEKVRGS
jgi:hypothetical protein